MNEKLSKIDADLHAEMMTIELWSKLKLRRSQWKLFCTGGEFANVFSGELNTASTPKSTPKSTPNETKFICVRFEPACESAKFREEEKVSSSNAN